MASRVDLLAGNDVIYGHLRSFGLLIQVGSPGKKNKTEAMYCPVRVSAYGNGDTPDLVLDCGGRASFTESFVYLGSLLHCGLSDHHDVDARIKKAAQACGALCVRVFSFCDVSGRLMGKAYAGGVLAVLMYGSKFILTPQRPSRTCLTGRTSVYEIFLRLPCAKRLFTDSLR
jgi:hypothetical protein